MFEKIGVSVDLLEAAHIARVSDREARQDYGIVGPAARDMAGIVFPYFHPRTGYRTTARVRRDNPEIEGGRPKAKYIAAYGDRKSLFFPPAAWSLLQTPDTQIALVEAEKSALAITAWAARTNTNILAVALGGVYGWRGRIGKAESSTGERVDVLGPVSDLEACDGRTVYVLVDANVSTNPKVKAARNGLVKELRKRNCTVLVCNLPVVEGVNGPDDLIAVVGDEALSKVFSEAEGIVEAPAEYSDDALALRFTEKYDDLRYTAAYSEWRRWDGSRWVEDDSLQIFDRARLVCREAAGECAKANVAQRITSAQTVAAVERLARYDRRHAATVDQWDENLWILNTPAGTVDLTNGTLRPSDRRDHCTKSTAVAPGGACPTWIAFLDIVTGGDKELQAYLRRVCGYSLTGSIRDHAMFFLFGSGANGKSVFTATHSGILGDYATVAPIESFTSSQNEHHPTDLAALQGARLVISTETEDGRRWAESKLKSLTGGDKIAARFMRQDFFEFTPQFKLLISGNHKPGIRTVDESMARRMNLVPFGVTIPPKERNPKLTQELRAEWPGVLEWMIEGCLEWQRIGLTPPAAVTRATVDYLVAEDSLATWMSDRCDRNPQSWTSAKALFESWKSWAESAGEYVGSQKRFSQNLEARGILPDRNMVGRGFRGISLRGVA